MDIVTIWNSLGWADGFLFSAWVGTMYYCKSWIDYRFRDKK